MLTAPHDAKPDQNGLGGLAVRLLCEVGRCAECTVHTAVRLKASRMAITGTVPEVRRLSSFGASSNRFTDTHELNSCGLARRIPVAKAASRFGAPAQWWDHPRTSPVPIIRGRAQAHLAARARQSLAAGFSNFVVIYSDLRVGRKVAYLVRFESISVGIHCGGLPGAGHEASAYHRGRSRSYRLHRKDR
jgi:hypothetical protein